MTQDEIIAMARQVGYPIQHSEWQKATEEFAALVAAKAEAKERDACATIYAQLFTDPENQPTQYGTVTVEFMNREIAKEREACAMVCEELPAPNFYSDTDKSMWDITSMDCAEAIRARGQA